MHKAKRFVRPVLFNLLKDLLKDPCSTRISFAQPTGVAEE